MTRIVTLDIETAPIIAYVWSLWKQNVGTNQIIQDWSILSVTWKWLDEKQCHYADTYENGGDIRDDSHLLHLIWEVLDEADIVVTQNGISFDIKKINARFIELGFPPPSPFKQIDTKVEAVNVARFTSNKLEWLAKVVNGSAKDSHKEFPGFELWSECLKGNPKAWATMKKYNPKDVTETEDLYLRLRPWIKGHPNVNVYDEDETTRCPHCGSHDVIQKGYRFTQVGKYPRFHCNHCNAWSRGGYTENTNEKRKSLLRT